MCTNNKNLPHVSKVLPEDERAAEMENDVRKFINLAKGKGTKDKKGQVIKDDPKIGDDQQLLLDNREEGGKP